MNYKEQLAQPEWQNKREEILERDNYKCINCGVGRSEFRNLARFKEFEKETFICDLKDLKSKGYLDFPMKKGSNSIDFVRNDTTWGATATYLGEKRIFHDLSKIRFCRKFESDKTNRYPELYFFYQETLDKQGRVDLNIHHKYYITGRKAWEYRNEALITLCFKCHEKTHNENDIYVYSDDVKRVDDIVDDLEVDYIAQICNRCNGSGALPEYNYYQNGVCFKCGGEGVILKE